MFEDPQAGDPLTSFSAPSEPPAPPAYPRRGRTRTRAAALVLALALVGGGLVWASRRESAGKPETAGPTTQATIEKLSIEGTTMSGRHVSLAELRGKPVLVAFFAHWCPHCQIELTEVLPKVLPGWQSRGGGFLAVSIGVRVAGADRELAQQAGILDDTISGESTAEIANRWGVQGIPSLFFLDRKGRLIKQTDRSGQIVDHIEGEMDADALTKALENLLAQ